MLREGFLTFSFTEHLTTDGINVKWVMGNELEQTLNALEREVLDEISTYHHPYQTITHYTRSLTIPDDETTEVIIKTKSAGACFTTSPGDPLAQTKTGNQYSQQSYASYIPCYVRENLMTIDAADSTLTYTQDPSINLMSDEDLQYSQRDVVDVVAANG